MATSKTVTSNFFNDRYALQLVVQVTSQSIVNNTSTIKATLYLKSYGHGYDMRSSVTKTGTITIAGTSYSISKSSISLTSGGQVTLGSATKTVTHADNGTLSINCSASFNFASIKISGTTLGTKSVSSFSFSPTTIPRKSTLSCNANWTAGSNKAITISRKASSFTHTVQLYVNGNEVAKREKVGASTTVSFSPAENTEIFSILNGGTTATTKIRVTTYSGSTSVGYNDYNGTLSVPAQSTLTLPSSANIGATISGNITNIKNSGFTHTLQLMQSNGTTQIVAILNKSASKTWSCDTSNIAGTLYGYIPNAKSYTSKLVLTTYYNGVKVGSARTYSIKFNVPSSSAPTFKASTINYKDVNSTIAGKTGNDQYIVQNLSHLTVTLPVGSIPSAKNSATMKTIQCTVGSETISLAYKAGSAHVFEFGTVNSASNQMATIKAIDSRGLTATISKKVLFVPYKAPTITASSGRADAFSTTVNINCSGTYSQVLIGGTAHNSIVSISRAIAIDDGGYGTAVNLTIKNTSGRFAVETTTTSVELTSIAKIKFIIKDNFDRTVEYVQEIAKGMPIFYIDAGMSSASFNALPEYPLTMSMGMKLDVARNQYWGNGHASYGINMGNSDLVHCNSIVFGDYANNLGEGLRFPNTTYDWSTDYGHQNPTNPQDGRNITECWEDVYGDYTNVFFRNQELWVDGGKMFKFKNTKIGGTTNPANHQITAYADGFIVDTTDATYNKWTGLIVADGTTRQIFDGNEIMYVTNDTSLSSGWKFHTCFIQASTINLETKLSDGSATTAGSLKVTNDSVGAYIQALPIYNRTSGSAANVYVHSNGSLFRSTSSEKYKLDIMPAFETIDEYKQILEIEPKKWFDKPSYEEYADRLTAEYEGEPLVEDERAGITNLDRLYGCTAEQLISLGLNHLVSFDEEGEPNGVMYDRIGVMALPLIKDLYGQVEKLNKRIQELEGME